MSVFAPPGEPFSVLEVMKTMETHWPSKWAKLHLEPKLTSGTNFDQKCSKSVPPGVIFDRIWSLRGGFEDLQGLFLNIPFPTVFQKVFPYKDRLQAMPFQRAFEKACCFFAARCPQGMPFHSPFEKAPLSRHLFHFFFERNQTFIPKVGQKSEGRRWHAARRHTINQEIYISISTFFKNINLNINLYSFINTNI